MTTPSVDRPVSEPMTNDPIAQMRRWVIGPPEWEPPLGTRAMISIRAAQLVLDRLDAAEARALPLPRRYTGGPLEDGLYLWRPAFWGAGLRDWASIDTSTLTGRYDFKEIVDAEAEVWLIGPISIPPIPESEGASS